MSIEKQDFGKIEDGRNVFLYILTNKNGLTAKITNYGGILTSLSVPDRNGEFADIVLGYETLEEYIKDTNYFGATIGRFANRIAKGKFTLNGVEYSMAINDGPNHSHGGIKGFNKALWNAEQIQSETDASLKLAYLSKDGEENYPGNLNCEVIYTLTDDDELKISYEARTDKTTIINLTHHSYFNLAGYDSGKIFDHEISINAEHFTPVDKNLIPTGQIKSIKDTPMDFTCSKAIGAEIAQTENGYDHNFVLNNTDGSLIAAATVYEPTTGRAMQVATTEPGLQFYTGNFLDGSQRGKGTTYQRQTAFCLEAQHYPDSPNQPKFPSAILNPGQKYTQLTVYKFFTKNG